VVPGGPFSVPEGTGFAPGDPVFNAVLGALFAGLFHPTQPTAQFANVARLPYTNVNELIASGMSVVGFSVRFSTDVMARTHGHVPYDNVGTIFRGSANDDALNHPVTGIERFTATPDAVNYFDKYFSPTGDLHIPVLTLHTLFDPIAPFDHERSYAQRVADAGASTLLTQRSISRYGHCAIKPTETMEAFDALAVWVNGGPKPAGGDGTLR
jgi:hypothetical protein